MPSFKPYPPELLPPGFNYPDALLSFASQGEHPEIAPWWLLDASSRAGRLAYSVRNHDGRNLVPFAKVDDGRGDLACLDGDDVGGDPKVLMLVLDESGRQYSFDNFGAWLKAAERDASLSRFERGLLAAEHVLNTEFSFDLAEPHYLHCLDEVTRSPELQPQFERLMLELFAERRLSDEPLAYLMHRLRWRGVRAWMESALRGMPNAKANGRPLEKVLAAYAHDWENRSFYKCL